MHSALSILIFMVLNQRTADPVGVDPGPDPTPTKTVSGSHRLETQEFRSSKKNGIEPREKPDPIVKKNRIQPLENNLDPTKGHSPKSSKY